MNDDFHIQGQDEGETGHPSTMWTHNNPQLLRDCLKQCFAEWCAWLQASRQPEGLIVLCDAKGHTISTCALQSESRLDIRASLKHWNESHPGAIAECLASGQASQAEMPAASEVEGRSMYSYAEPIINGSTMIAVLGYIVPHTENRELYSQLLHAWTDSLKSRMYLELAKTRAFTQTESGASSERELKKRDILFQVAKKLHANIDVDSVLSEIIHSMKEIYPEASVELYLSQDSQSSLLTVRPLIIHSGREDIHVRAYIEGRTISTQERTPAGIVHQLAVPLHGQQGVYGVLHVTAHERALAHTELDVEFISELADSAGTAFENARLFESSNVLVSELRLINEITRRLNQSLKLNEIFDYAADELLKIFKADYSLILQTDSDQEKLIVQSGNLVEMSNDSYDLDYGYAGVMIKTKEPVIVSDYSSNPKVRSKLMETTGSRSLIGSPILVSSGVVGVILVAHRLPHYFSYENFRLLQVLSGHIGLAITNASLHAEVRRMVVTDNLTGLYVRHYLDEQIKQLQKKDFCGSLIVADLDHFKSINDAHGHQIGDKCLQQVSNIIRSSIRETDIAARWGGEELAIYLPQLTIEQAYRIAERIRQRVERETDPKVTVSCGISYWSHQDKKISVENLFYKADMALYEAKRCGRNQVRIG